MKQLKSKKSEILTYGGGRARECSICNKTYWRRNIEERWFFLSIEKVWTKRRVVVCTACSDTKGANLAKYTPAWASEGRTEQLSVVPISNRGRARQSDRPRDEVGLRSRSRTAEEAESNEATREENYATLY